MALAIGMAYYVWYGTFHFILFSLLHVAELAYSLHLFFSFYALLPSICSKPLRVCLGQEIGRYIYTYLYGYTYK